MDKLAEGLQKLGEDDLLQVVQMVHDNKSEESWMRNDVDRKSSNPPHHGSQHVCEDCEGSALFGRANNAS